MKNNINKNGDFKLFSCIKSERPVQFDEDLLLDETEANSKQTVHKLGTKLKTS